MNEALNREQSEAEAVDTAGLQRELTVRRVYVNLLESGSNNSDVCVLNGIFVLF